MKMRHGLLLLALAAGMILSAEEIEIRDFNVPGNWKINWKPIRKDRIADGWFKVETAQVCSLSVRSYPLGGEKAMERPFTGIVFKVKGDGSDEWGRISVQAGPMGGGAFYFPLKSKEAVEYRAAFSDMAPTNDNSRLPGAAIRAGEITGFQLGDRWNIGQNNARRKPFTYGVSGLKLTDEVKGKFVPGKCRIAPVDSVIAKMKAKKQVLILCFGDSITAGTSLRNKDQDRYATVLQGLLRKKYGYDGITVRSVAVGGAHTYDSIGWLDRDLAQGKPDAATMLIGYNNRSNSQTKENYAAHLERWLELFALKTGGKAPVVLLPTLPAISRFHTQRDMAEATREVAKKYGLAVAPADQEFTKLGPDKLRKFVADGVHPNPEGHKIIANELLKAFSK